MRICPSLSENARFPTTTSALEGSRYGVAIGTTVGPRAWLFVYWMLQDSCSWTWAMDPSHGSGHATYVCVVYVMHMSCPGPLHRACTGLASA
ncbi:hypothetical protein N658DRAFT_220926 [Parathielavia hyrcaniae]|uniref:Uncharacterized protein n=1 Tax=Parathielavia hyrcaniae TaxID=113614 RepID=A0AAN6PV50_9PEZI|nr:hypothetical protein N658DRAFT_220926 [Parathielavia hyrcaniae]